MKNFFKIDYDSHRNIGLDLLRAIAIGMVMLLHGNPLLPEYIVEKFRYFILDGVSIFFVLSGFLIGGIFIKLCEKQQKTQLI